MLLTLDILGVTKTLGVPGLGVLSMFRANGFDTESWNFVKTALSYQIHGLS